MSADDEPFTPLMQQANRGKRSIALDVSSEEGYAILCRLVARADVFLTKLLPDSRARLQVDVEDVRVMNPSIAYTRGSGYGPKGDDRNTPGFDGTTFWAQGGAADNLTPGGAMQPTPMRPSLGDLPGATTLAGAVAVALLHRERAGAPAVVDVSLLNVAIWGNSPAIIAAAQRGGPIKKTLREDNSNSVSLAYRTADERSVKLSLFQSDRHFERLCECLGIPELARDPRFADAAAQAENRRECTAALDAVFGRLTLDEVQQRLADLDGAWSTVQDAYEVSKDPQALVNGYLAEVDDGSGKTPIAASPWQFGETRYALSSAPEHGADSDSTLLELGLGYDDIIRHKVAGVVF